MGLRRSDDSADDSTDSGATGIGIGTILKAPFRLIALPFRIVAAPFKAVASVRRSRKQKKAAKNAERAALAFSRMSPRLQDEVRRTRARFD